jgi:hypothetical protein
VSLFTISLFFQNGTGSRSPRSRFGGELVGTNGEGLPCAMGIQGMGGKNADAEQREE